MTGWKEFFASSAWGEVVAEVEAREAESTRNMVRLEWGPESNPQTVLAKMAGIQHEISTLRWFRELLPALLTAKEDREQSDSDGRGGGAEEDYLAGSDRFSEGGA